MPAPESRELVCASFDRRDGSASVMREPDKAFPRAQKLSWNEKGISGNNSDNNNRPAGRQAL